MPRSILVLGLVLFAAPAAATELAGQFGYIGEWEFAATIGPLDRRGRELSGTYSMRHTAACMPGEVADKAGAIVLTRGSFGGRATARMSLDGLDCTFAGPLSESRHGLLACPGKPDVPMRLWLK